MKRDSRTADGVGLTSLVGGGEIRLPRISPPVILMSSVLLSQIVFAEDFRNLYGV